MDPGASPVLRGCDFLEVLLGNGPLYDSDDIYYDAPPPLCYNVNGDDLAEEAPRLTPLD